MRRFSEILLFIFITVVSTRCNEASRNEKAPAVDSVAIATEKHRHDSMICVSFFDTLLPKDSFNGSILVAKGGKILFEKYQGRTKLISGDTISGNTVFHIASSSKPFTAISILKLNEEGKLKLTDTLQKYFPDFPYKGITIELLLTHRSQLPDYIHFMKDYWSAKSKKASNKDVLGVMVKHKPKLRGTPGKSFLYSNTNFLLLALIVEQVGGTTFPEYLKKQFFDPLKMNQTFVYQPGDENRITPSFNSKGEMEPYTFLDQTYGDKNIYSTVGDMLKWDQALYSGFISENILAKSFEPTSFEKKGISHYGRGWRMYLLDSTSKIIYHNGWWHGNNSCFYRAITDSLTIIIQGNRMNKNIYHVNPLVEMLTNLRFPPPEKQEEK
jgi:CubicO group peptidase (beta-lactamase class C family)